MEHGCARLEELVAWKHHEFYTLARARQGLEMLAAEGTVHKFFSIYVAPGAWHKLPRKMLNLMRLKKIGSGARVTKGQCKGPERLGNPVVVTAVKEYGKVYFCCPYLSGVRCKNVDWNARCIYLDSGMYRPHPGDLA